MKPKLGRPRSAQLDERQAQLFRTILQRALKHAGMTKAALSRACMDRGKGEKWVSHCFETNPNRPLLVSRARELWSIFCAASPKHLPGKNVLFVPWVQRHVEKTYSREDVPWYYAAAVKPSGDIAAIIESDSFEAFADALADVAVEKLGFDDSRKKMRRKVAEGILEYLESNYPGWAHRAWERERRQFMLWKKHANGAYADGPFGDEYTRDWLTMLGVEQ